MTRCGLLVAWCLGALPGAKGIRRDNGELWASPPGPSAPPLRPGSKFFLWMTDIHVDPLYGVEPAGGKGGQNCKTATPQTSSNVFGTMGCNPPYALLRSAVAAAAEHVGEDRMPEFFLFTGDASRHGGELFTDPADNVSSVMASVTEMISAEFPGRRFVFGGIGNNDAPTNYGVDVTTGRMDNLWFDRVGRAMAASGASSTGGPEFRYGSFYEEEVGGLTILTIVTVPYSARWKPSGPQSAQEREEDPFNQFAWLRERLLAATLHNKTVWIVGHIMPGIETHGNTELWSPRYVEAYLRIVQDPFLGRCIAAQLFGHVHSDEFRLLPNAPVGAGPILAAGAVSPIYNNNPSFRLVEYDAGSGRLLSYRAFWAELTTGSADLVWRFGYDLADSYEPLRREVAETGALTQRSFTELADALRRDDGHYETYTIWFKMRITNDLQQCSEAIASRSSSDGDVLPLNGIERRNCRDMYRCTLVVSTQAEFQRCAEPYTVKSMEAAVFSKALETWQPADTQRFYQVARLAKWAKTFRWAELGRQVRKTLLTRDWGHFLRWAQGQRALNRVRQI